MVIPLIDQDILSHKELVVRPFSVAELLGSGSLVVESPEDEGPVLPQLLDPVLDREVLLSRKKFFVKVGDVEEKLRMVAQVEVVRAELHVRDWGVVDRDLHQGQ